MVTFTETVICGCMQKTLSMQPVYRMGKRSTQASLLQRHLYKFQVMYFFTSNVSSNVAKSWCPLLCVGCRPGDIVFFLVTNILHIYACMVTIVWVKSNEEATRSSTVELGVTVECWWLVQETLLYFINVINSFTQPFSLVDGIHRWKLFRNIGNMTQVSRECWKFQPYSAIRVKILLTVLQKMDSFRSLDFIVTDQSRMSLLLSVSCHSVSWHPILELSLGDYFLSLNTQIFAEIENWVENEDLQEAVN